MWAISVVVPGVTPNDELGMPCIDDKEMVQALGSDGPDEPFRIRVGIRVRNGVRRIWAPSDRMTSSELATYFRGAVSDEDFTSIPLVEAVTGHVPRPLGDPFSHWGGR